MTAPSMATHPGQSQSSIGAACASATTRTFDVHGASVAYLARGRTRSSTATCPASSCGMRRRRRIPYGPTSSSATANWSTTHSVASTWPHAEPVDPQLRPEPAAGRVPAPGAAFSDEISRDRGAARKKIEVDEHSQSGTILEALAMLRPAFEENFLIDPAADAALGRCGSPPQPHSGGRDRLRNGRAIRLGRSKRPRKELARAVHRQSAQRNGE